MITCHPKTERFTGREMHPVGPPVPGAGAILDLQCVEGYVYVTRASGQGNNIITYVLDEDEWIPVEQQLMH